MLTISSTYGSTFTVRYKALKKLCHIKHAWARTIHTFQVKIKKLRAEKMFSWLYLANVLSRERVRSSLETKIHWNRNILESVRSFLQLPCSCPLFSTCLLEVSFDKVSLNIFQGSEEKTVVYVVGNPGRQHWQHVYTAVTRGRCRVYIVAEEMHLRRAVTTKNVPRKTRLQRFLREAIVETSNCPSQTSSPLTKSQQNQELETESAAVTQGAPDPPEPLADLVKQEGSAVLNKGLLGHLQQSPCKRPHSLAENPEDAVKKPSVSIS